VRLFSKLKLSTGGRTPVTEPRVSIAATVAAAPRPIPAPSGYAVLDLETTGFCPSDERILELGVVCVDRSGGISAEWTSRFNPEGHMGASQIHGITLEDVVGAPLFRDRVEEIARLLQRRVLVAHNAVFDIAFLRAEFERAGWRLPAAPAFCTLQASWYYLPELGGRRLPQCCRAVGIDARSQHVALDDARATAALLRWYLDPAVPPPPLREHLDLPELAVRVAWPIGPSAAPLSSTSGPVIVAVPRQRAAAVQLGPTLTSRLADYSFEQALNEGAPAGSAVYLQLLLEVLEDGVITVDEGRALAELAKEYGLNPDEIVAAHRGFLSALAGKAVEDDHVSRQEREELRTVARLLDLPERVVPGLLSQARDERATTLGQDLPPLPDDWTLGEPLRVGDRVAITGCAAHGRQALEQRATAQGITVSGGVSRTIALLVSDGTVSGTKARAAAEFGVRIVRPEQFNELLDHVQPAMPKPAAPKLTVASATTPHPARLEGASGVDPSLVREWARANGIPVGTRGRLRAGVIDAYLRANTS